MQFFSSPVHSFSEPIPCVFLQQLSFFFHVLPFLLFFLAVELIPVNFIQTKGNFIIEVLKSHIFLKAEVNQIKQGHSFLYRKYTISNNNLLK